MGLNRTLIASLITITGVALLAGGLLTEYATPPLAAAGVGVVLALGGLFAVDVGGGR